MRLGKDDAGSFTVEAVLLVPVIFLFAVAAVSFGRIVVARQEVVGAARAAAQVAAIAPDAARARAAGSEYALESLASGKVTCRDPRVSVDTDDFLPGGRVVVSVSCRVNALAVGIPGLPRSISVEEVGAAPIDPYRSVV
jgi:Flp pilus assembly protein TadG